MDLNDRLRKTPRQARSRSTVGAILEAAERVLRSEGYHAASTNRVARVAGFSVGSLYQYFDDKRAVVGALLDQALRGEAERIGQLLDALARLEPAVARDRLVRGVLAERRSKAHLLRILDAHGRELGYEAPLRHALSAQAGLLADPLHRFAAARLANAFRGAFDEGLAVVARFLHALSYPFAVDEPEHLDEESIAARVSTALLRLETVPVTPGRLAGELHAAWVGGAGGAFADAPPRARRLKYLGSLTWGNLRDISILWQDLDFGVYINAAADVYLDFVMAVSGRVLYNPVGAFVSSYLHIHGGDVNQLTQTTNLLTAFLTGFGDRIEITPQMLNVIWFVGAADNEALTVANTATFTSVHVTPRYSVL